MPHSNRLFRNHLLNEPANFLHSMDIDGDRATFIRTSRTLLSEATFVDGRSPIGLAPPETTLLSSLTGPTANQIHPSRFIFHMSFCGSTQLARLIDVPRHSLVLKEPNCLVDLSNWKSLNRRAGKPTQRLGAAIRLAKNLLGRPFALGEAVTVKPSSWANNLIDELASEGTGGLPVFVTIDRSAFLRAVFRGGTDRMAFAAQLAWHMASEIPEGDHLLELAVGAGRDPLAKAANMALVAHHLQLNAFGRALRRRGWGNDRFIDFRQVTGSPYDAALKACRALRLPIDGRDLERNVEKFTGKHSKVPSIAYSPVRQSAHDAAVLSHHGQSIETALAWSERVLGTEGKALEFDRLSA